eukprot:3826885-Prymnesium_polylepis.2
MATLARTLARTRLRCTHHVALPPPAATALSLPYVLTAIPPLSPCSTCVRAGANFPIKFNQDREAVASARTRLQVRRNCACDTRLQTRSALTWATPARATQLKSLARGDPDWSL